MVKLISYISVCSGLQIRRIRVLSRSVLNDNIKAMVDNKQDMLVNFVSDFYK